jgi:hypothetical protein
VHNQRDRSIGLDSFIQEACILVLRWRRKMCSSVFVTGCDLCVISYYVSCGGYHTSLLTGRYKRLDSIYQDYVNSEVYIGTFQ